ncbi:hypothetical protein HZ326_16354 [Fusarium oxysporum f. sp. albedinis]|nr:hypothetical protein HZ326_16354 [Fusarium oxysporum f. sp. albedinis]
MIHRLSIKGASSLLITCQHSFHHHHHQYRPWPRRRDPPSSRPPIDTEERIRRRGPFPVQIRVSGNMSLVPVFLEQQINGVVELNSDLGELLTGRTRASRGISLLAFEPRSRS